MTYRFLTILNLYFVQAIKIELAYRIQILQRFLGITIAMLGTTFFWFAVSSTGTVASYTPQAMLFYFIMVGFHDFLFMSGDDFSKKIGEEIRNGKLSNALIRPFPFLASLAARWCGGIVLRLMLASPLLVCLYLSFLSDFQFSKPLQQIALYFCAVMTGSIIVLICLIFIGLLAFDMTHVWSPWVTFVSLYCVFSGYFFPADQAYGIIKNMMEWSPFYYLQGFPILILLGRLSSGEIMFGFFRASCVIIFCLILVIWQWRRGIKKFEAIGI